MNDTAPDFTLKGVDDFRIGTFRLSDSLDDGVFLILNFSVFDFSPVCTTQMWELSDIPALEMLDGVEIWGIAPDGPYAHKAHIDEYDSSVPLLCDTTEEVAEAYDVLYQVYDGCKRVPKRSMFLLDDERRVQLRWVADDNWDDWENAPPSRRVANSTVVSDGSQRVPGHYPAPGSLGGFADALLVRRFGFVTGFLVFRTHLSVFAPGITEQRFRRSLVQD